MLKTNPADDELEVSIFGPGVGESVVVHLGAGQWMIVDSCVAPGARVPAALEYLSALGVDVAERVRVVAVTHWHDDHTAGVASVLGACSKAQLFCTAAIKNEDFFRQLVASQQLELRSETGSGLDEMGQLFNLLAERKTKGDGRIVTPQYASAHTIVFRAVATETSPECVVEALSPSSMSVTRSILTFEPRVGDPKRKLPNPGPNELSVVLHVRLGAEVALLGADLETGTSNELGWRAVLGSARRPHLKAAIVKVPHHGSAGADLQGVWQDMVKTGAHAGVTSFSSSGLPKPADLQRLKDRTTNVFHTSPAKPAALKLDSATTRTLDGVKIRERRGQMGHVRFRARGGVVTHEVFGTARSV